jgi:hypothetical protein
VIAAPIQSKMQRLRVIPSAGKNAGIRAANVANIGLDQASLGITMASLAATNARDDYELDGALHCVKGAVCKDGDLIGGRRRKAEADPLCDFVTMPSGFQASVRCYNPAKPRI